MMKGYTFLLSFLLLSGTLCAQSPEEKGKNNGIAVPPAPCTISKKSLQDKIKEGWAGQTIGVTFGGPTEFKFNSTMIQDYQPIPWYEGYVRKTMEENPDLFDDIYMDLTFADIFEGKGLDAPVEAFASAYANAEYML